jgi:hypothetical protein
MTSNLLNAPDFSTGKSTCQENPALTLSSALNANTGFLGTEHSVMPVTR